MTQCAPEQDKDECILYRQNVSQHANTIPGAWNAHHILPVQCVGSRPIITYVEKCLKLTKWNINDKHNITPLPRKSEYTKTVGAPVNLCCHNVDHMRYNDECTTWLTNKVWNKIAAKEVVPHDTPAEAIQGTLNDAVDHWRGELTTRGSRAPGTIIGWRERGKIPNWHYPFSMCSNPPPRHPNLDLDEKKLKALLALIS
jgi:hypothetical protein